MIWLVYMLLGAWEDMAATNTWNNSENSYLPFVFLRRVSQSAQACAWAQV